VTVRLGVDIGGTGIKGAPVNVELGDLTADRFRLVTPKKHKPAEVVKVVHEVVQHFPDADGPIGVTFPGVIIRGVVHTAANMDRSWIGLDADKLLTESLGRPVTLMNDADAAGVAEMRFGAGKDKRGVVVMITLGTGIGCAVFHDGVLLPNTELGHIEIQGKDAERLASGSARDDEHLSWKEYGKRIQRYLRTIDSLLWPDLFILGGGISKEADKYLPDIKIRTPVVTADLLNNAGIVGAASLVHAPPYEK
jgi:polyphosphate glucokinase